MFPSGRLPLLLVLMLLPLVLKAPAARAAWPHDPNNGNVPLCTASDDQNYPAIVSDGAGGAIVTWQDSRNGGVPDIYAQRVNAAGVPQWTAGGVAICSAVNSQFVPTIASDGAGGAIITWYDQRNGADYDIYAQRVNAAGVPQWTANGVAVCIATNSQIYPTIVSDGAGGAIVTWYDLRSGVGYDIYAQRVNAAGVPQWTPNGAAICTATNNQFIPTIVSDGAGGAIVTWSDFRSGLDGDIYAQRVNASGVPQWTANGVALCTAVNDQAVPMITPDGAGGAIVTWSDFRSALYADVYAQRVNAAGLPQWTLNGVAVCTAANSQQNPVIVSDGAGGAIITWEDYRTGNNTPDIYAQRVSAAGVPQWTLDGTALSTANSAQISPAIASDGAGGAIVTWYDYRSGTNYDIYAQRVSDAGSPEWNYNGVAVSTANSDQEFPVIASDGAGGAIITWDDYRSGNNTSDIYAQRIERFGYLGNPEPVSAGVRDVPNDQGGKVKVSWYASYLDADPSYQIANYSIWRSAPPNVAAQAIRNGARLIEPGAAPPAREKRVFTTSVDGVQTIFWELVGTQTADGDQGYSIVTPTTSDSVAALNPKTLFRIQAHYIYGPAFWNSAPDSGYSVDNLPPVAPAPFTGAYLVGATNLHWGENFEADLAGYRLYRGSSSGFIPSPANLIAAKPDTGYSDAGPAGSYYKLSAVDIHGNESGFDLLTPGSTLGTDGNALPHVLALAAPRPNPARDGTLLSFALPEAGPVTLAVYGTDGRHVRTLSAGQMEAGEHQLRFDLRDAGGRQISSGIYFVRLEANGRTITKRLAIVE
jgi:FlgD Ig-like domain